MRLTDYQRDVIREASNEVFGANAVVKLFGSRVNDELKGGDIDLLIESRAPIEEQGLKISRLVARLQLRLGDRKIDVICIWPGATVSPIHQSAMKQGLLI